MTAETSTARLPTGGQAEELRADNARLRKCIVAARNVLAPLRNPILFRDPGTCAALTSAAVAILDSEGGVLPAPASEAKP